MSLRMMDFRCSSCQNVILDILTDTGAVEVPTCCGKPMERVWLAPPSVDARQPFYDPQAGRSFTSFREADRHAAATGCVNYSLKDRPRIQTPEERIAEKEPQRREAIAKTYYRLRYGYKDHPPLETEESLRRSG